MWNETHTITSVSDAPVINNFTALVFCWIVYTVVFPAINIFGMISNVINVRCFSKLGYKEPINISLIGLSISDFGILLTSFALNILYIPAIPSEKLPFDINDIAYIVVGMPHLTFVRITGCITAVITIERCLCITLPLKVNRIVTSRRMMLTTAGVYLIIIACSSPIYSVNRLGWIFDAHRNRTLVRIMSATDKTSTELIYFTINSFIIPFVSFIAVTVSTVILVCKLQQRSKWQELSITALNTDVSKRNQKVTKMVVMISALFISSYVPISIIMFAVAFEPDLFRGGRFMNIGVIIGGIGILLESINSSANIFIYYHSSSKYNEAFSDIFRKTTQKITHANEN